MRRLLLVACLLGLASAAQAQTVTKSLTWSQVGEALATVSTYTWALKIDAAAAVAITPTCQTNGANTDCATPVVLASGNHTLTLTAR